VKNSLILSASVLAFSMAAPMGQGGMGDYSAITQNGAGNSVTITQNVP